MADYTIGSFGGSGGLSSRGQGFKPNVAGPNGSGGPGQATTVNLVEVVLGYQNSTTDRDDTIYLYDFIPDISDLNDDGTGALAASSSQINSDGTIFGTGSFSRTFTFESIPLNPATQYYIFTASNQYLRIQSGNPYGGGVMYGITLGPTTNDTQFQMTFSVLA